VLVLFVLGVAAFFAAGGHHALTLESLRAKFDDLEALYGAHPAATIAGFSAAYVLLATSSLPGGAVLTMVAGALFGLVKATLVVSFASSVGALLAMLLARYVLRDWIRSRFGERLRRLDEGIERDGALYLFMVRLVPAIPFFLVNLGAGLTRMRAWRYYWVSQLGMLPGTLVFVHAGRRLAEIDSPRDVLSPGVLGALALLAALAYGSRLLKRRSESAARR
jgi:uncharacterized membrane protein YdjX (TVP38/TMEM64 family)